MKQYATEQKEQATIFPTDKASSFQPHSQLTGFQMLWLRRAFVLKPINHNSQSGKGKLNFSPNPQNN